MEIKIECPFSGVTKSGRVWRKVPESDARSVESALTELDFGEISWRAQSLAGNGHPSMTVQFSVALRPQRP